MHSNLRVEVLRLYEATMEGGMTGEKPDSTREKVKPKEKKMGVSRKSSLERRQGKWEGKDKQSRKAKRVKGKCPSHRGRVYLNVLARDSVEVSPPDKRFVRGVKGKGSRPLKKCRKGKGTVKEITEKNVKEITSIREKKAKGGEVDREPNGEER